jgi:hypothetical protein
MADIEEGIWLHARAQVTLVDLSRASGLPEEVLRELVGYGALEPADPAAVEWSFSAECLARVRAAARLRGALELETESVALVLSFLERIARLEAELGHLRAQLAPPRR